MKTITRTIASCRIEAEVVHYNEKKELIHEEIPSIITTDSEEKVRKNLAKYFDYQVKDGQTLVIKSIEKSEKVYEVPVDKFIELAESLEIKEEAEKIVENIAE